MVNIRGIRAAAMSVVTIAASTFYSVAGSGQMRHDVGQSVAPVFEGWEGNVDGTFSLHFGYMNRNYSEQLDIPVGPNNRIEPGGPDQGQPEFFLNRRQKNVFRVVVPSDFDRKQQVVWTLVANGKSESVPGSLDPRYEINTRTDIGTGNKAPLVQAIPDQQVDRASGATLAVVASDDGMPKRRNGRLTVEWSKYRGPGVITFDPAVRDADEHGRATTRAHFESPGAYIVSMVVNDGSRGGTACCWTGTQVRVMVK